MSRIFIVDDDYGSEILADALRNVGHDVQRLHTADEAVAEIERIATADLLILDVMMPPGGLAQTTSGGRTAGMAVYRQLRSVNKSVPVLAYTASSDQDVLAVFQQDRQATVVPKWSAPSMTDLLSRINGLLGVAPRSSGPRSFIVHGHDEATKLAVKNYLQNTLGLPEPIILHEQPNIGRTIIEKFEAYAAESAVVFVLLTPDDVAAPAAARDDEKRRARQNVIFELGYFLGAFGRAAGRVSLLHKGPLELPSDLAGLCYIDIGSGVEAAGEAIRKELAHVIGR
jgi:CheY-like chemotaxis protein